MVDPYVDPNTIRPQSSSTKKEQVEKTVTEETGNKEDKRAPGTKEPEKPASMSPPHGPKFETNKTMTNKKRATAANFILVKHIPDSLNNITTIHNYFKK